jgi:hypothetical protein
MRRGPFNPESRPQRYLSRWQLNSKHTNFWPSSPGSATLRSMRPKHGKLVTADDADQAQGVGCVQSKAQRAAPLNALTRNGRGVTADLSKPSGRFAKSSRSPIPKPKR